MNNESGFEAFRRFQENPKDTLIFCADDLYRQESGLLIRHVFWGVIYGLLCGTAVYLIIVATEGIGGQSVSSVHEFVAALKSSRLSPAPGWVFGAMTGAGWGASLGKRRAVHLRANALMALALAHIEVKLSNLEESNKPPEHGTQSPSQSAI